MEVVPRFDPCQGNSKPSRERFTCLLMFVKPYTLSIMSAFRNEDCKRNRDVILLHIMPPRTPHLENRTHGQLYKEGWPFSYQYLASIRYILMFLYPPLHHFAHRVRRDASLPFLDSGMLRGSSHRPFHEASTAPARSLISIYLAYHSIRMSFLCYP